MAAAAPRLVARSGSPNGPGPADRLAAAEPARLAEIQAELAEVARSEIGRLAGDAAWSPDDVERLTDLLIVDRERFAADREFRARVVPAIAAALPPAVPGALRDTLLVRLSERLDIHDLAAVELEWETAERGLLERLAGAEGGSGRPQAVDWPDIRLGPAEAPIGLSVYSLGSRFFSAAEATTFLRALRRWDPERAIVVLADYRQSGALAETATELEIRLSQTWSRGYSPWPRDPMSFLVRPDGRQVAVLRPNRQRGREDDSSMALELIQDLPEALDRRFGPLTWTVAPIPFHNGNLLPAGAEIWLSIHSLEPRSLELLRIDRVPVESFARPEGVQSYVDAARAAADEVAHLFGRAVRFVHPLPAADAEPAAGQAAMERLGGGAGFDLDSVLTLLPHAEGGPAALVGDLGTGAALVAASSDSELDQMRATYELGVAPPELRAAIERWHRQPRATRLASFLDLVAEHLADEGVTVRRLPLIQVPTALLERSQAYSDQDFLVGWNNVVLQQVGEDRRAEGFAAGLATGDARARALFSELGYRLELLPPLVESVLRNGGYRCASNHLRESARD